MRVRPKEEQPLMVPGSSPALSGPRRLLAAMALGLISLLSAGVAETSADSPLAEETSAQDYEAVLELALEHLGKPYKLGTEGPDRFDCSGLVYRVFVESGEEELIGGTRRRAIGYYRWFADRGLVRRGAGKPGDLVIWGEGKHIGFYLGDGRAISALLGGVTIHDVHGITWPLTAYLQVQWGSDIEHPAEGLEIEGPASEPSPNDGPSGQVDVPESEGLSGHANAAATGTMNLRTAPGPSEQVIGWVGRRATFTVTAFGHSPSGALWFSVTKRDGRVGWVYSRWVDVGVDLGELEATPAPPRPMRRSTDRD